jgi:hypothetical protein
VSLPKKKSARAMAKKPTRPLTTEEKKSLKAMERRREKRVKEKKRKEHAARRRRRPTDRMPRVIHRCWCVREEHQVGTPGPVTPTDGGYDGGGPEEVSRVWILRFGVPMDIGSRADMEKRVYVSAVAYCAMCGGVGWRRPGRGEPIEGQDFSRTWVPPPGESTIAPSEKATTTILDLFRLSREGEDPASLPVMREAVATGLQAAAEEAREACAQVCDRQAAQCDALAEEEKDPKGQIKTAWGTFRSGVSVDEEARYRRAAAIARSCATQIRALKVEVYFDDEALARISAR